MNIACQRCSNYIFILESTPGLSGLGKYNGKMRRETFKFWDLVRKKFRGLTTQILQMPIDMYPSAAHHKHPHLEHNR